MRANVKLEEKPRLVIYGVGQFGQYIVRYAIEKQWPIVAAFNRSGEKVGRDIAELAGLDKPAGVLVQDCETADYSQLDADIAVIAMTDRLAVNMPAYERMIGAGLNVVCHGSESSFPELTDADSAAKIDALCKSKGVTFTGTGIWDYSRVWPAIVAAGPCTRLDSLFHISITDAEAIGKQLMLLTGVGMSQQEFDEKITKVDGMVGGLYKSIPQHVLIALGYTASEVVERREPVLFDKPIYCRHLERDIPPGECAGTRIVIDVKTKEGVTAVAHIELRLFEQGEEETMTWKINGQPSSQISVTRDDAGHGTAGCLFNRIPDVIAAQSGIQEFYKLGPMLPTAAV